jgi:hypothetical protein
MTYPPGGMMANRLNTAAKQPAATVQRTNATTTSPSMTTRPLNGASTSPLRRQNSRTKLTPQQQALAMTNGMIAANMAAAVNAPNKASLQLAMQQQLQQQLQASGGNLPANMQAALQKKIQAAALMQQQQQQQQQRAAAASTNGNGNLSMSPIQQANMLKPNGLGNGQNGAMNLKLPNRPNNMMQQAFNAQQQQGGSSNAMNLAQTAASQASTVLQQVASLRNQAVNGTSPVMMNGMQAGSPLLNGSPQFSQQQLQQLQQQQKQKQQLAQMQAAGTYGSPMLGLQSSPVMISAGGSPQQMALQSPTLQMTAQQQRQM